MTKKLILEFKSLEDLFAFRQTVKVLTEKTGYTSLIVSCELTSRQLAQAISLNAIPIMEEEENLLLSDYLPNSVFKNVYKFSDTYKIK